jgi:ribonucleoside-diphosphate reductase alpha chain
LSRLGYAPDEVSKIVDYVGQKETIEGAPGLRDEHLEVFDCAFRPRSGSRSIAWTGHVRMMGAVQPFLSGAISKTVNLPEDASVEDITKAYTLGWTLGLKALAVYRDGSKRTQPLNSGKDVVSETAQETGSGPGADVVSLQAARPLRRKLPDERQAFTHKFSIAGHEGYLTIGLYDEGKPGEIFLRMAKEGSTISGLMDTIATMTSVSLQYGVPLKALVDKFSHTRFEPSGITNNREIPIAKSLVDYVFRYLGNRYLETEDGDAVGAPNSVAPGRTSEPSRLRDVSGSGATASPLLGAVAGGAVAGTAPASFINQADAPSCMDCGSIMIRNGACYKCHNCGTTSGCS